MKRNAARISLLALGLVMTSGLTGMLAAQESLLPPVLEERPPVRARVKPSPPVAVAPRAAASQAARSPTPAPRPSASATPARVPPPLVSATALPEDTGVTASAVAAPAVDPVSAIDPSIINQLVLNAAPKFDIPPNARRSLDRVGVLAQTDGGLPFATTHYLSGDYVGALLNGIRGPLVSRWGHILLRRALMSRLDTPVGMNGADWAAIRAGLLLRMGEADAARALVQEVDSGFYTRQLEDVAMAGYLSTADPAGLCPLDALTAAAHPGWDWDLSRSICLAFNGTEGSPALAQLDRALKRGAAAKLDILLAQKFAGSANTTHRAVQIEWEGRRRSRPAHRRRRS